MSSKILHTQEAFSKNWLNGQMIHYINTIPLFVLSDGKSEAQKEKIINTRGPTANKSPYTRYYAILTGQAISHELAF